MFSVPHCLLKIRFLGLVNCKGKLFEMLKFKIRPFEFYFMTLKQKLISNVLTCTHEKNIKTSN